MNNTLRLGSDAILNEQDRLMPQFEPPQYPLEVKKITKSCLDHKATENKANEDSERTKDYGVDLKKC